MTKSGKMSDWDKAKEHNLYFALRYICRFLDSLAVNLEKMDYCNKEWVVYPVYNENDVLNLEWKVKRRTDLFFLTSSLKKYVFYN